MDYCLTATQVQDSTCILLCQNNFKTSSCDRCMHCSANTKVAMKHFVCSVFSLAIMILNVKLNKFLFKEAENPIYIWHGCKKLGATGRESHGDPFLKHSLADALDENGLSHNNLVSRNLS